MVKHEYRGRHTALNAFRKLTEKLTNNYSAIKEGDTITLTFQEIEKCIGRKLEGKELSGRWWTNNSAKRQAEIWINAGFLVSSRSIDIECVHSVRFTKHNLTKKEKITKAFFEKGSKVASWVISVLLIPVILTVCTNHYEVRHILDNIEYNYSMKEYEETESLILQNLDKIRKYSSKNELLRLYEIQCEIKTREFAVVPGTAVNYINKEEYEKLVALTYNASELAFNIRDARYTLYFCQKMLTLCVNQYMASMDLDYLIQADCFTDKANQCFDELLPEKIQIRNQKDFLTALEIANMQYAYFLYDYCTLVYSYSKLGIEDFDEKKLSMSYAKALAVPMIIEDLAYNTKWLTEEISEYMDLKSKLVFVMTASIFNSVGKDVIPVLVHGGSNNKGAYYSQDDLAPLIEDIISISMKYEDYDTLAFIYLIKARICFFDYNETENELKRTEFEDSVNKWLTITSQSSMSVLDFERYFMSCASGWLLDKYIRDVSKLLKTNSFEGNEKYRAFLFLQLGTHYFYQALEKSTKNESEDSILYCYEKALENVEIAELYYSREKYIYVNEGIEAMRRIAVIAESDTNAALQDYYNMMDTVPVA